MTTKGSLLSFVHSAENVARILGVWAMIRALAWTAGLDALGTWDYILFLFVFLTLVSIGVCSFASESENTPSYRRAVRELHEWIERIYKENHPDGPPRRPTCRPGYVYLVKGERGYYKIGRTRNPQSRVKTFGVELPFDVTFEHLIYTDNMVALERYLHSRYRHRRVRGEWFALTSLEVAEIKAMGDQSE